MTTYKIIRFHQYASSRVIKTGLKGCPDSHLFTTQECKWCGTEFRPAERRRDYFCCASCASSYHGLPEPEFDESYAIQPD